MLRSMTSGRTTATDWTVRKYREGDEAGLVELFRSVYPRWPANEISAAPEEHLCWKLHSRPEALRFQTVAVAGERVIGARLLVAMAAKLGGEEVLACNGIDNAVAAEYQNQRVLNAMRALDWDEFNASFDVIVTDQGSHRAVHQINVHAGIRPLANAIDLLSAPSAAQNAAPRRSNIRTVKTFDEHIDSFWELAAQPFNFAVKRGQQYLNWRYADERAGPFVIRIAEDTSRITGYVVLRPSARRGYIADLLTLPDRQDVVAELIEDAQSALAAQGAETIECCLPRHHPYRAELASRGYALRRTLPIGYRPMRVDPAKLAFLEREDASIHVTYGDFDLV
jgi:hypothetical protein